VRKVDATFWLGAEGEASKARSSKVRKQAVREMLIGVDGLPIVLPPKVTKRRRKGVAR
jgi:hypothetical protein